MRHRQWLLGAVATLAMSLTNAAWAAEPLQRCPLELVRLTKSAEGGVMMPGESSFENISPQHFSRWISQGKVPQGNDSEKQFREVVKKEPEKYLAKNPFRGVAKFGSKKYGFALDKRDEKAEGYDRLYFDLNGNGDLTDDQPIEKPDVAKQGSSRGLLQTILGIGPYRQQEQFPRVDLTIDVDGKPLDYSFFFEVNAWGSGNGDDGFEYITVSLRAAAYRRGEITLNGQRHSIAVLDHNSNGRFDDLTHLATDAHTAAGELSAEFGDMLVFDSNTASSSDKSYTTLASGQRVPLGKLNLLLGRLYELKVSSTGDELTCMPSATALGKVAASHAPCDVRLIGDAGYLELKLADTSQTAEVPVGEWRVFTYDLTAEKKKEAEPKADTDKQEKDKLKSDEKPSLWKALKNAMVGASGDASEPLFGAANVSTASAVGTTRGKVVQVAEGQTTVLTFGPPFKAQAKLAGVASKSAEFSLAITGVDGENVYSLNVDGRRPPKPKITITDSNDKVAAEGDFEYG